MTQSQTLEILKLGKNVFLTGAPGAGKTFVLNQYIDFLRERGVLVAVTAYTGIAASHLNGRTLHSWAGLSFAVLTPEQERERVHANERLTARIRNTNVLIIDEISMLHPEEFARVDFICKTARESLEPFGGLQLICCGDFFQIPPVSIGLKAGVLAASANGGVAPSEMPGQFVIDSPAWSAAKMMTCYLHEQHRQGDAKLLQILDEIRQGHVGADALALLRSRINAPVAAPVGIARLYTHNENVDAINVAELAKLKGPEVVYDVRTTGGAPLVEKLKKDYRVDRLVLKIGARVMFMRNNLEDGYANGTLGEVVDFVGGGGARNGDEIDDDEAPSLDKNPGDIDPDPVILTFSGHRIIVTREAWELEEDGKVRATIRQMPLRLAWAITVHKSQGMTLDAAEIDLSRAFEPGMGYVALSRVKSLENISLLGLNAFALEVSPRIKSLDTGFWEQSEASEGYLEKLGPEKIQRAQEDFLATLETNKNDEHGNRVNRKYSSKELRYEVDEVMDFAGEEV